MAESSLAQKILMHSKHICTCECLNTLFQPIKCFFVIQTWLREAKKMDKTIQTLGCLYDDLAKHAADLKVSPDFSKILASNMILAVP